LVLHPYNIMSMCDRRARKIQKQLQLKLQEVKQLFPIQDNDCWLVDLDTPNSSSTPAANAAPALEPRIMYFDHTSTTCNMVGLELTLVLDV
jgi:hypothetical protein